MPETKISEKEYVCNEVISIEGEIGISLEIYDKINDQPFNFGIYSIKLDIDDKRNFEAKYNYIGFEEGFKVFTERDYSKYTNDKRKVYNLYKKNILPSSFVQIKSNKKISFNDRDYHNCKIIASDFNGNDVSIEFTLLSVPPKNTTFDLIRDKNGITIPGLSKRDSTALIKIVKSDPELVAYGDGVSKITNLKEGYITPFFIAEGKSYLYFEYPEISPFKLKSSTFSTVCTPKTPAIKLSTSDLIIG